MISHTNQNSALDHITITPHAIYLLSLVRIEVLTNCVKLIPNFGAKIHSYLMEPLQSSHVYMYGVWII